MMDRPTFAAAAAVTVRADILAGSGSSRFRLITRRQEPLRHAAFAHVYLFFAGSGRAASGIQQPDRTRLRPHWSIAGGAGHLNHGADGNVVEIAIHGISGEIQIGRALHLDETVFLLRERMISMRLVCYLLYFLREKVQDYPELW